MRKKLLTIGGLAVTAYAVRQWVLPHVLIKQVAQPSTNGAPAQEDLEAPYEEIWIPSAGGRLHGRMVKPDQMGKAAVLIFPSGVEGAAAWAPAQQALFERGIASMVFDYPGFGKSDGSPSLSMFHDDPLNAYETFRAYLPPETRIVLLGHGLGVPIIAHAFANYDQSAIHSLVLHGGLSNFRAQAVIHAHVPEMLAQVALPQLYDTLENIGKIEAPTLIVHSKNDQVNPLYMAYEIYRAAAQPKRMIELEGVDHFGAQKGAAEVWDPVAEFIGVAQPA
jgi:hypothetical protein